MFRKLCFIGTQKSQNVIIKNKVQRTKVKINKTKVVLSTSLSRKKVGYIIPTMNCYARNV